MKHELRAEESPEQEEEQPQLLDKPASLETIELELPNHTRIYCSSYSLNFDELVKRVFEILEKINRGNGTKAKGDLSCYG